MVLTAFSTQMPTVRSSFRQGMTTDNSGRRTVAASKGAASLRAHDSKSSRNSARLALPANLSLAAVLILPPGIHSRIAV